MFSNRKNQQEMTIVRRWLEQTSFTIDASAVEQSQFATKIFQRFAQNFDDSSNAVEKYEEYAVRELTDALSAFRRCP